jgi:5-methyltetrahydropteroyltriglutamate--homocysteine methyltransferase
MGYDDRREVEMTRILTQTLGYPRIGPKRETKRAVEAFWKSKIDADELMSTKREVEEAGWIRQLDAGIDRIGVGDSTLYDHVLDWTHRLGLIPERFTHLQGLERYFAMARGQSGTTALELTKWFDTNYHYLVPEIGREFAPRLAADEYLSALQRAQVILGERAVPIVLGPVTLLALSRLELNAHEALERLLPHYMELLRRIQELGVPEVQLHEPALILDEANQMRSLFELSCQALAGTGLPLNLVTYFDDVGECWPWLVDLPVDCISLDFTRGQSKQLLDRHGWPEDKSLGVGIVDGRSVWALNLTATLAWLQPVADRFAIRIGASSSLQFVPYSVASEPQIARPLAHVLSFAEEKLDELVLLARAANGDEAESELNRFEANWEVFRQFAPDDLDLRQRLESLEKEDFERSLGYGDRRTHQIQLPPFPTTTIGSFPQTNEIRQLRALYIRGEIDQEEYFNKIDAWIGFAIGVQEGLGLDVLVHGEFERSDMVEYFAQKLTGFTFTQYGWVQSFGTRYVRPPIIHADVKRPESMTVREFSRAQSFTSKPVKGMLTGPVTILNWSFPRDDIPRREIALQLALALRQEVEDLEAAGARAVQVDEPALREGLPFKHARWDEYLDWAVDAFRLATGGAAPGTQIHTHMCYAEFGDVMVAIDRMDADVISIENARSDDETLHELAAFGYNREVGPGVYDIHSPVVPGLEDVANKLATMGQHLPHGHIWVNPDCGLKTRSWNEVIPALGNLVAAAEQARRAGSDLRSTARALAGEA